MVLASFARPLADGPSFALLIRSSISLDVRRAILAERVTKLGLHPLRLLCFLLLARKKRNDRGYHRNRDVGSWSRCLSLARELESSGRVMTRGQREPRSNANSFTRSPPMSSRDTRAIIQQVSLHFAKRITTRRLLSNTKHPEHATPPRA